MSAARPAAPSSAAAAQPEASAAVQTIPPSSNDGSTVAKSATGDFPLAAIICVAIVGGIIFLFVCYRLYVRWWRRRQQSAAYDTYSSSDEPKSPNPLLQHHHPLMTQRATMSGSAFSPFSPSTSSSTLLYPAYAHGSYSSRGSLAALSSEGSLNNMTNQQHFFGGGGHSAESSNSLSTSDSRMAALNQLEGGIPGSSSSIASRSRPTSPQGPPRPSSQFGSFNYIRGDSSMSTDQLRTQGSRLSTFQAATRSRESLGGRRSMLSPQHFGSQSSLSVPTMSRPPSSRVSGAPHLRHTRIEIVPPQPLAPPPGTVVATDKSTLAFSPLSGIGTPDSMPNSVSGWFKPDQASSSSTTSTASSGSSPSARGAPQPNQPKRSTASESTTRSEGSSSASSGENPQTTQFATPRSENENVPRSNSPQSPLDKLKKQLEGHASKMSTSGSPDGRRARTASGVVTQEDIEAYRRG